MRTHHAARAVVQSLETRRLLSFGEFDPRFGVGGKLSSSAAEADEKAEVLLQPDAKLITVGSIGSLASSDIVVRRYLPDRALDASFETAGQTRITIGGNELGSDVALASDGSIIIVGLTISGETGPSDGIVVRVDSTSVRDLSSGTPGVRRIGWSGEDAALSVAIDASDRIVVAGIEDFVNGPAMTGATTSLSTSLGSPF
jgi:hypothetical protein